MHKWKGLATHTYSHNPNSICKIFTLFAKSHKNISHKEDPYKVCALKLITNFRVLNGHEWFLRSIESVELPDFGYK